MVTTHQDPNAPMELLDPVCGMTFSPGDAVGHVEHNGQMYYFCNDQCLERFRATPDAFLDPDVPQPRPPVQGATFICPMDPEIRQPHPGACPKCGMALEPDLSTVPAMRVEYTAPVLGPFTVAQSISFALVISGVVMILLHRRRTMARLEEG